MILPNKKPAKRKALHSSLLKTLFFTCALAIALLPEESIPPCDQSTPPKPNTLKAPKKEEAHPFQDALLRQIYWLVPPEGPPEAPPEPLLEPPPVLPPLVLPPPELEPPELEPLPEPLPEPDPEPPPEPEPLPEPEPELLPPLVPPELEEDPELVLPPVFVVPFVSFVEVSVSLPVVELAELPSDITVSPSCSGAEP